MAPICKILVTKGVKICLLDYHFFKNWNQFQRIKEKKAGSILTGNVSANVIESLSMTFTADGKLQR